MSMGGGSRFGRGGGTTHVVHHNTGGMGGPRMGSGGMMGGGRRRMGGRGMMGGVRGRRC